MHCSRARHFRLSFQHISSPSSPFLIFCLSNSSNSCRSHLTHPVNRSELCFHLLRSPSRAPSLIQQFARLSVYRLSCSLLKGGERCDWECFCSPTILHSKSVMQRDPY
ncbi:hypothetical protein BDW62DRAFT_86842 [Aspergillus aurantiobrunneus]